MRSMWDWRRDDDAEQNGDRQGDVSCSQLRCAHGKTMNDPTSPAPPMLRSAATMIVLREQATSVEVLMTRRHADLAFMGGMWVFPGGTLALSDQSEPARKRLLHRDRCAHVLRDLRGSALPGELCLALAIAACRETFEEAGVLLATHADGSSCTSEQLARLQPEREAIAKEPERFVTLLEREKLFLDVSRLVYWAHWITPSPVPRRFDTRFFVAAAPTSHAIAADRYETTECAWLTPKDLLAAAARGEMKIAQPTRYNLEDLQAALEKHRTLDALLGGEAGRRVSPILPKLFKEADKATIVYPWDPEYFSIGGDGIAPGDHYYEAALRAMPSRIERDA